MVRPRTILLSYFPQSAFITQEVASKALRDADGDIDRARELLEDLVRRREPANTDETYYENTNNSNNARNTGNGMKLRQSSINQITNENDKRDHDERRPPNTVAVINNLSDRQYCCVWSVEVYDDGYRPEVARTLLALIAHHVNPILRARGWRVKRLMESASTTFIGCCTGNGRYDADAASTNIQLNLRMQPNKHCTVFRTFSQLLSVMLHEITHTSIGLEDIHPYVQSYTIVPKFLSFRFVVSYFYVFKSPAFYDLMNEIKEEYHEKLVLGEVALETDMYGCDAKVVTKNGNVMAIFEAAADIVPTFMSKNLAISSTDNSFVDDECGVKRLRHRRRKGSAGYRKRKSKNQGTQTKQPPLLKGAKLIDKRTAAGKRLLTESATLSRRDLAARAAMARVGVIVASDATEQTVTTTEANNRNHTNTNEGSSDDSSNDSDDEYTIQPHQSSCACRSCDWDRLLFVPEANLK